jgi:ABC-type uncharacterized transport system involved in gliding motility auxiliary subunit
VVDQASKLLCSWEGFERRNAIFSAEKMSEAVPSPRSATGATRGEGESPSGRTAKRVSDQASKLLCSREGFERRNAIFSAEKMSEAVPSPRSATGATRGEGESPSGRTAKRGAQASKLPPWMNLLEECPDNPLRAG